jgi:hypothetical protein
MMRFVEGDWHSLMVEAMEDSRENVESLRKKMAEQEGADVGGKKSGASPFFLELMRRGEYKKAMSEAMLNGGDYHVSLSPKAEMALKEKIKKAMLPSGVNGFQPLDFDGELFGRIKVSGEDVLAEMRSRNCTKGPGASGLRLSHIKEALSGVDNGLRHEVADEMAAVINVISSGRMPMELIPYVLGGRGGIQGEKRVFVAMESLMRVAEALVQGKVLRRRGRAELCVNNYGVGLKGAPDTFNAWVKLKFQALHRSGIKDVVLVEVDAWNMFFEIDRAQILRIIMHRAPELYPLVRNLTQPQFVSFFRGSVIEEVTSGVPIGSGLAALVACIVEEVVLSKMSDKFLYKEGVLEEQTVLFGIKGYIDNVFMVCRAHDAKTLVCELNSLGRQYGLIYGERASHRHKVFFPFVGPNDLSKSLGDWKQVFSEYEMSAAYDRGPMTAGVEAGSKFIGVPFGSNAYVERMVRDKYLKLSQKMNVLVRRGSGGGDFSEVPAQLSWILVKMCVVAAMDFFRRCVDPDVAGPVYDEFDKMVTLGLEQLVGGSQWWPGGQAVPNECTREWRTFMQLHLPPSRGGLGIRRMGGGTALAAAIASVVAAYGTLGDRMTDSKSNTQTFMGHINCFNKLVKAEDAIKGNTFGELMVNLSGLGKVQKVLTGRVAAAVSERLYMLCSDMEKKQLVAMRMKGASAWMCSPCYGTVLDRAGKNKLSLSSVQFAYLIRRALIHDNPHGMSRTEMVNAKCGRVFASTGAQCTAPIDVHLTHGETLCRGTRGGCKHSALQNAVIDVAREVGGSGVTSGIVRHAMKEGKEVRVDCTLQGVSHMVLAVDVNNSESRTANSVAIPVSGELQVSSLMERLVRVENKKRLHYTMGCEELGWTFLPVVSDSHGGFGPGADELVGACAEKLQVMELISKSAAMTRIRGRFQTAFMKQIAINGLGTRTRLLKAKGEKSFVEQGLGLL